MPLLAEGPGVVRGGGCRLLGPGVGQVNQSRALRGAGSIVRTIVWLLVLGLIAGSVYAAVKGRYEYSTQGTTQVRRDRWTGDMQVWGCAAYEFRGTENAYFPMAPGEADKPCTRFDWVTQKAGR